MTATNNLSGFANSGLWPLDPAKVCSNGIRTSLNDAALVYPCSFNTGIRRYFTEFERHGPPEPFVRGGYISTDTGIELMRNDVMEEIRALEHERLERVREREDTDARRFAEDNLLRERKRIRRELIEISKANDRVHRYGAPFELPRPLHERRSK